jgi:hypothetical protein
MRSVPEFINWLLDLPRYYPELAFGVFICIMVAVVILLCWPDDWTDK